MGQAHTQNLGGYQKGSKQSKAISGGQMNKSKYNQNFKGGDQGRSSSALTMHGEINPAAQHANAIRQTANMSHNEFRGQNAQSPGPMQYSKPNPGLVGGRATGYKPGHTLTKQGAPQSSITHSKS